MISMRVRFTIAANRLINFFREDASRSLYGNYSLKAVFMAFGAILAALKKISLHFLYVASIVLLGTLLGDIAASGGYAEFFAPGETPAMPKIAVASLGGDRFGQWDTEIIGGSIYRTSEYIVTSDGQLLSYTVSIIGESIPLGIKMVNSEYIEKAEFSAGENFKVIIPNSSAIPSASFELDVKGEFYENAIPHNFAHYILWVWFVFSFAGGLFGASALGSVFSENENIMVNYFCADPALYAKSHILLDLAADMVLYLPCLLIGFSMAGMPARGVFVMLLMYAAFRLSGKAISLFVYSRTKKHFGYSLFGYMGILAAALYFPVYFALPEWNAILTCPIAISSSAIAAVLAWLYIRGYDLYAPFLRNRIRRNQKLKSKLKMGMTSSGEKMAFDDAQKWHENLGAQDIAPGSHENKTGFAYLNAIFFDRHRNFFRKKILQRIGIFLILPFVFGAILSLGDFLSAGHPGAAENSIPFGLDSWEAALMYAPAFFLISCLASMGRAVTSSVFSNCDIAMLHYPCYCAKKNIFASFLARFAMILRYNFVISAAMSFSVVAFMWFLFGYMDYIYAGIFIALVLCMGVFFAFSDLFLYYAIQPYDSAKKNRSMVYKIASGVIAFFAYVTFELRIDLMGYSIFMGLATVLYLCIGTLLLLFLAPKNFKLR